jgi:cobalt-zinc-cadmium efflux system outer membrane protein
VQSAYLLRMTILALVLTACTRGGVQAEGPVRRVAVEMKHFEEAADSVQPPGVARPREEPPGRTSAPPSARKESKEKRRPTVPVELPEDMEEETTVGISLDEALPRLLAASRDLAVKYQDIPKARADVLSAGLIENPAIFFDGEGIPYGNYSRQRPGETGYGATVILPPLDINGKRQRRIDVARRAERVLEALYQDAVRQEIDRLYSAYVDVLEFNLKRNALRRSARQLNVMMETVRTRADQGGGKAEEVAEVAVRRAKTGIDLRDAEANLLQARRELALLLAVPVEQADTLPVRGSLRDPGPPPPGSDELVSLALRTRPDLAAFQLSVEHARANVELSRAERWDDLLLFYTPYQGITFPSQQRQTASAWEVGGLAVLPVFERNQGDIARGRANVTQLQIQLRELRDQVIYGVQHAATEYAVSRQLIRRYEDEILPAARRLRDEKQRHFREKREDLGGLLATTQQYDEIAQRYLEVLVTHRRNMLRLNTAIGQRVLP